MKTALIYGTTGLIGRNLLSLLLESPEYREVRALTRRPLNLKHDKLQEIKYDFEQPVPALLQADHVFCCMGTTLKKAGSRKAFYRIDHDFVVDTARFAHQRGSSLFSLVSAIGADPSSRIFYNRVKGEIEKDIREIGFKGLHVYQPSLLMGDRTEFRLMEGISQKIMNVLNPMVPQKYRGVLASKVAEVMLTNAEKHPEEQLLVSNAEIIQFSTQQP
jgi:uncharacterized protein YbjT (DUF2867 family)